MTQRIVKILDIDNFKFGWELEYQNKGYSTCPRKSDDIFDSNAYEQEIADRRDAMLDCSIESLRGYQRNILSNMANALEHRCSDYWEDKDLLRTQLVDSCDVSSEAIALIDSALNRLSTAWNIASAYEKCHEIIAHLDVSDAAKLCYGIDEWEYRINRVIERVVRNSMSMADYTTEGAELPATLTLPDNLEWVYDGSVSGGEIRTAYGNSGTDIFNAKALLRKLEASYSIALDLQHDYRCSFHVHVSNSKLRHSYGDNMQCFMYQYLLEHLRDLPISVLRRLSSDADYANWRNQYFAIRLSADKYRAIAFRDGHGSWEFRFMGNISNANDGVKCLDFARDCYLWAYKQVHIKGKQSVYLYDIGTLRDKIVSGADSLIAENYQRLAS